METMGNLPAGELQFVDENLDKALEKLDDTEKLDVLVRPVCSQKTFIEAGENASFGQDWEDIGIASVSVRLSESECQFLIKTKLIESIELKYPVKLL